MIPTLIPNSRGLVFSAPPKVIKKITRALDENESELAEEFRAELDDAYGEDIVSVYVPTYPDPCYREFMTALEILDVYYETR
jgi:hypothetical protein